MEPQQKDNGGLYTTLDELKTKAQKLLWARLVFFVCGCFSLVLMGIGAKANSEVACGTGIVAFLIALVGHSLTDKKLDAIFADMGMLVLFQLEVLKLKALGKLSLTTNTVQ